MFSFGAHYGSIVLPTIRNLKGEEYMLAHTLDAAALVEASSTEILDDVLVRICNAMQLSSTQFSLVERR